MAGESLGFQGLREEGGLWSSTCVQTENLLGAEKGVLRAPPHLLHKDSKKIPEAPLL